LGNYWGLHKHDEIFMFQRNNNKMPYYKNRSYVKCAAAVHLAESKCSKLCAFWEFYFCPSKGLYL